MTDSLADRLLKLHRPLQIFGECDHHSGFVDEYGTAEAHGGNEPVLVEEIGWTCADALQYVVCSECCTDGDVYQTEDCVEHHSHSADPDRRCSTVIVVKEFA